MVYITVAGVYGACRAVMDLGLKGKLKIVCHDDVPDTKKMTNYDVISATICQEQFLHGSLSVKILFDNLAYGIPPKIELNYTNNIIKIKDNLENPNSP